MILLIDKPAGITSFDVIRRLRRKMGVQKMGHAGTLDPLASGLMIIATEEDTGRLSEFLKLPKTYEAIIRLGESRATGDLEGDVVATATVPDIAESEIRRAVTSLTGTHVLPVPRYAAVKLKGRPLYAYARSGKDVTVPRKPMTVQRASCEGGKRNGDFLSVSCVFDVESGTYIRSIAERLGNALGYPAVLEKLRRTRIGSFSIEDAAPV